MRARLVASVRRLSSTAAAAAAAPEPSDFTDFTGFVTRARARLRHVRTDAKTPAPPPAAEPFTASDRRWIDVVRRSVYERDAGLRTRAIVIVRALGFLDAMTLLRALGELGDNQWPGSPTVDGRRFSSVLQQSAQQLVDAYNAGRRNDVLAERDRRDFGATPVYTIDDVTTTDVDDAISIEPNGDGTTWVHVHISDPTALVPANSPLDLAARARGATVYLPYTRVPMFPELLSCGLFSLEPGREAEGMPAMTFSGKVDDATGVLVDARVTPSIVRRVRKLNFDAVDAMLESADESESESETRTAMQTLLDLSEGMMRDRFSRGALQLNLPENKIEIGADNAVSVKPVHVYRSSSSQIVREVMLLANRVAADYCRAAGIPVPYRVQPHNHLPQAVVTRLQEAALAREPMYADFSLLSGSIMNTKTTTVPGAHWTLGLASYTQATSPIRRYTDVLVHYQLKAHLRGERPPFTAEQLDNILYQNQQLVTEGRLFERSARTFCNIRYYEGMPQGTPLEGVVLRSGDERNDHIVMLQDSAFTRQCRLSRARPAGATVPLVLSLADSRTQRLFVTEKGGAK